MSKSGVKCLPFNDEDVIRFRSKESELASKVLNAYYDKEQRPPGVEHVGEIFLPYLETNEKPIWQKRGTKQGRFTKLHVIGTFSVTKLGDLLHFWQLFKAFDNNYIARFSHILRQFW